jgi:SAM-dependent methyltransferase
VTEFSVPASDEPFDFRRQAASYARFRRDYSDALYDTIEAHAGAPAGRRAIDLGCGTGFVAATLRRRGWDVTGVDFSEPMLREARGAGVGLARGRGEAIPIRTGGTALLASGTAFHWFAPVDALREITRVLVPDGWAALFWRYARPGEPTNALLGEVMARFGVPILPDDILVHAPDPFAGAPLRPEPRILLDSVLRFTAEGFHGYVSTLESVRRIMGPHHPAFLDALREETARRFPDGIEERNVEYLFLARRA